MLATLVLSAAALLAGTLLCCQALDSDKPDIAKQVFAVVGVLFGLLAAGGLGTLFANRSAETAENAARSVGGAAATEVSKEVNDTTEELKEKVEELQPEGQGGQK